jgi:hypothetical protein
VLKKSKEPRKRAELIGDSISALEVLVIGRTTEANFTVGTKANADVDVVMMVTLRNASKTPREKAISFRRKQYMDIN